MYQMSHEEVKMADGACGKQTTFLQGNHGRIGSLNSMANLDCLRPTTTYSISQTICNELVEHTVGSLKRKHSPKINFST